MFLEPLLRAGRVIRAPWALGLALVTVGVAGVSGFSGCYTSGDPPAPAPSVTAPRVPQSTHNRLKFKGGTRYADDLASALSVPRAELCRELSTYDCADVVHRISLGGVEPYRLTVYRPLPERSVASAQAVDRIALSGCEARAAKDFADPAQAALFRELTEASVTPAGVREVSKRLYVRVLRRAALEDELVVLDGYFNDLRTSEGALAPRRFATLACFMVATTEEALFY